jgi:hypothetical protein
MPVIAGNGLLILVPAAIVLDRWAAAGVFDARFYVVQAVELLAGGTNLTLMGLNVRDGLRLSGGLRPAPPEPLLRSRATGTSDAPGKERRHANIRRDG